MSGKQLSILMVPGKTFPCTHAVLEEIYTRILPQRGHTIRWVMKPGSPDCQDVIVDWNGTKVYLFRGFVMPSGRTGRPLPGLINATLQALRDEPVDLLQVRNGIKAGLLGAYIARRCHIPLVFQWSFERSNALAAKAQQGLVRNQPLKLLKARMQDIMLHRVIFREATLILLISEVMARDLLVRGVSSEKMLSFPPGFDATLNPETINRRAVRDRYHLGDDPTVLYFGSMSRLRKLDFVIRVVAAVAEDIPNIRLLMVGGDKEPGDVAFLRSYAKQAGQLDRIVFTGQVPREEVPQYVVAADVVLCPRAPSPVYYNSFPIKLLEAMGLSRPVVVTNVPAQEKVVRESGAGICVPYEESAFAQAILALLRDPQRTDKGAAGRRYVLEHHTYDALARRVEERYYTLVRRAPAAHYMLATLRQSDAPLGETRKDRVK